MEKIQNKTKKIISVLLITIMMIGLVSSIVPVFGATGKPLKANVPIYNKASKKFGEIYYDVTPISVLIVKNNNVILTGNMYIHKNNFSNASKKENKYLLTVGGISNEVSKGYAPIRSTNNSYGNMVGKLYVGGVVEGTKKGDWYKISINAYLPTFNIKYYKNNKNATGTMNSHKAIYGIENSLATPKFKLGKNNKVVYWIAYRTYDKKWLIKDKAGKIKWSTSKGSYGYALYKTTSKLITTAPKGDVIMYAVYDAVKGITLESKTLELTEGTPAILKKTITPSFASNQGVTWTSSNSSIAKVSSSGTVTPVKAGTAIITVTSKENSTIKATCTINVSKKVDFILPIKIKDNQKLCYSSGYGARKGGIHRGIDYVYKTPKEIRNAEVVAVRDGKVVKIEKKASTMGWGTFVKIYHGKIKVNGKNQDVYTLYAHLEGQSNSKLNEDTEVKQGDTIGLVGLTGNTNGYHLHFEVYVGGSDESCRVDPTKINKIFEVEHQ